MRNLQAGFRLYLDLARNTAVKKASEYRRNAKECRRLAKSIFNPEHIAILNKMAATWEHLAHEREEHLAQTERIAALEAAIPAKKIAG